MAVDVVVRVGFSRRQFCVYKLFQLRNQLIRNLELDVLTFKKLLGVIHKVRNAKSCRLTPRPLCYSLSHFR